MMNGDWDDNELDKYIAEFVVGLVTLAAVFAIVIGVFGLIQG